MARGRRLEAAEREPDPWVALAAAILQRAVDDAHGRRLYGKSPGARAKTIDDARYWLRNGAGGLPAYLGIDDQAMGATLDL